MLRSVPEDQAVEILEKTTNSDAIVVEEYDSGRLIRLLYHPPKEEEKIIDTPIGKALATSKKERALSEKECRQRFSNFSPDDVFKTEWDYSDHYEVVLIYKYD